MRLNKAIAFLLQLPYCKQVSLPSPLHAAFFHIFVLSVGDLNVCSGPQVLSGVPQLQKTVLCLLERICVLDKHRSGRVLLVVSSVLMNQ